MTDTLTVEITQSQISAINTMLYIISCTDIKEIEQIIKYCDDNDITHNSEEDIKSVFELLTSCEDELIQFMSQFERRD